MGRARGGFGVRAAAALLALAALGCVDEKVVYRDAARFNPPSEAAAKFLGYHDAGAKLTTCGNCHVGPQAEWQETRHAGAWQTLQASGHAQAACEGCHTVNSLGNAITAASTTVGWGATKDPRYQDVQCESCHGPGLDHVQDPDAVIPLASIAADTGALATNGCGECHSGAHTPFVAEWKESLHGRKPMRAWTTGGAPQNNDNCRSCHTGQGALRAFQVDARSDYVEKDRDRTGGAPEQITCAVCHDPHSNRASRSGTGATATTGHQLRYRIDVASEDENLCMKCHHRRGTPDLAAQTSGPHSPQGPLLLGVAGWWPPNLKAEFAEQRIRSTHGTERNPRLCAGCHMETYSVNDTLTKAFKLNVVGHRFLAIPCVAGPNDEPTRDQSCGLTVTERRFNACTGSCHGSEDAALNALLAARARIFGEASVLNGMVSAVRTAKPAEFTSTNYTTAEGSYFNVRLAVEVSGTTLSPIEGNIVHNPFLVEALLCTSIVQMKKDYADVPAVVATPDPPSCLIWNTPTAAAERLRAQMRVASARR
ncbi:MAG TPA: multiheme c-type cytochrome [Gemmatimonadaceae bacterium]|nr:multiheme c-type cytochrome [Gemmatimonadaceae bacterium]